MRRYAIVVFTTVLGVVAVAAAGAGAAAFGSKKPSQAPTSVRQLAGVNFISGCRFSHRAPNDPIVFPGQAGRSHDHTFVANRTTNAFSTLASLLAGATTCQRAGDTAAYWAPTLINGGTSVQPFGATIYYRRQTLASLQAFPAGLKVIAGDARATAPQPLRVTSWNCGPEVEIGPSSTVPTCPDAFRNGLRLHVRFPNCWDGVSLDSADHKSHMAYSERGRCPATHPVALPAIELIMRYPSVGGSSVSLASGGQYSGHADFFNAWNQAALQSLVDGCLNALRHCAQGS